MSKVNGNVMLLSFSFKNSYSFYDESTLDLRALADCGNEDFTIEFGKSKILPVASIYGANASGKTNQIKTLHKFIKSISNSHSYGRSTNPDSLYGQTFSLSNKMKKEAIEFSALFQVKRSIYKYKFSVIDDEVANEELRSSTFDDDDGDLLFSRNKKEIKLHGTLHSNNFVQHLISAIEKNLIGSSALFISWLGAYAISPARDIFAWCNASCSFWMELDKNSKCRQDLIAILDTNATDAEGKDKRNKVIDFAKRIDPTLLDVRIVYNGAPTPRIDFIRKAVDEPMENDPVNISFTEDMESDGTIRLLLLYPQLTSLLEKGGVLFVDELDRHFHSLMFRSLVGLFHDRQKNTGKAQLIFTTHNPVLFNLTDMREDEIWIVKKDEEGKSRLCALSDYNLSKIANISGAAERAKYYMAYLAGYFGGIPRSWI